MHGCHSPGSGRITAPGSSCPQSMRMVQRNRRPTSNVDSITVVRARRGTTLEISDFPGRTAAADMQDQDQSGAADG